MLPCRVQHGKVPSSSPLLSNKAGAHTQAALCQLSRLLQSISGLHLQGILLKSLVDRCAEMLLQAVAVEGEQAIEALKMALAGLQPGSRPEVLQHASIEVVPQNTAPKMEQPSQVLACASQAPSFRTLVQLCSFHVGGMSRWSPVCWLASWGTGLARFWKPGLGIG